MINGMNKKGQGISINTVIIAAIALAVLVVLFLIFTGRLNIFNKGLEGTVTCENACKAVGMQKGSAPKDSCTGADRSHIAGTYSDTSGLECCCQR